ncbi:conserved rodent malaria protein, unknown function [Plasmodium vinckei]|uniref:Uncharacterized protein n=1 Tax=Plasmodium vinckei TaxID=5860 RepID=A0A6V7SNE9_PLAVN|nr:conserved rodent malaria protein, unknown function [Plasmodium vinckei]
MKKSTNMFPYFALICVFLCYKNASFAISPENKIKNGGKILLKNDNPVKELSTEEIVSSPNEYNITNQCKQNNGKKASTSEKTQKKLFDHNHKLKKSKPISVIQKAFRKIFIIKPSIHNLIKKKSNDISDDLEDDPEVTPYSKEIESEIDALKDNDEKENLDNKKEVIDAFRRKKDNPIQKYMEDNADDKDDAYSYSYDNKNDIDEDDKDENDSYNDKDDDDECIYDYDDDDECVYDDDDDDECVYDDEDDESRVIKKKKKNTPAQFGAERDPMVEPSYKPTKIRDKPSYIKDKKKGENPVVVVKKGDNVSLVEYDYDDEPDILTKIRSINKIDVTLRDKLYDEAEQLLFERVIAQKAPTSKYDVVEKLLTAVDGIIVPVAALQSVITIIAIIVLFAATGC